jgi:hypothetical protein
MAGLLGTDDVFTIAEFKDQLKNTRIPMHKAQKKKPGLFFKKDYSRSWKSLV